MTRATIKKIDDTHALLRAIDHDFILDGDFSHPDQYEGEVEVLKVRRLEDGSHEIRYGWK